MRRSTFYSARLLTCSPRFPVSYTSSALGASRYYALSNVHDSPGAFSKKEKAAEDQYMQQHERELLERLRVKGFSEDEVKEVTEELRDIGIEPKKNQSSSSNSNSNYGNQSRKYGGADAGPEYITQEEFVAFRRDIVQKIRHLEDEILALQTSSKKKSSGW